MLLTLLLKNMPEQNIPSLVADIRNKLSPFWNLVALALETGIEPEKHLELMLEEAKKADKLKDVVTSNLSSIVKISQSSDYE